MADYGELMIQAMDLIAKGAINSISYDTTKSYTISDNSQKDQGIYTVTDGSVSFIAYSEASYRVGEVVYVQIPEGDFNNQKLIIGKKINNTTEPYKYVRPSDLIIPFTEIEKSVEAGLIANKNRTTLNDDEEVVESTILIYDSDKDYQNLHIQGNDKLWISADFKTTFFAESGEYGFRIILTDELEKNYTFYFSSNDMFGSLYPTGGFFPQEQIFDIKNINPVKKIQILFYEKGNFKPYWIPGDNAIPNIFVKDLKIKFGIGTEITDFNIICDDGSEGIYNVYSEDGNILDLNLHTLQRTLSLDLDQAILDRIDTIQWVFPDSKYSMIEKATDEKNDSTYYIGEKLYNRYNDNVVKAIIRIGNNVYKAEKVFTFGKQGTYNDNKLLSFVYDKHYALTEFLHDESLEGILKIYDYNKQPVSLEDYEITVSINNGLVECDILKNWEEPILNEKQRQDLLNQLESYYKILGSINTSTPEGQLYYEEEYDKILKELNLSYTQYEKILLKAIADGTIENNNSQILTNDKDNKSVRLQFYTIIQAEYDENFNLINTYGIYLKDKPYILAEVVCKKPIENSDQIEELKLTIPLSVSKDRQDYAYITGPTEIRYTPSGLPDFLKEKYVLYNDQKKPVEEEIFWSIYNVTLYEPGKYYVWVKPEEDEDTGKITKPGYYTIANGAFDPEVDYYTKDSKKKVYFYQKDTYYYYSVSKDSTEGQYQKDAADKKTEGRIYFNQYFEYQISYLTKKEFDDIRAKGGEIYYYDDTIINEETKEEKGYTLVPSNWIYDSTVYYRKIDKYEQINLVDFTYDEINNKAHFCDENGKDLITLPNSLIGYKWVYNIMPLQAEPTISLDFRIQNDTLTPLGSYFNNLEKQKLLLVGQIKEKVEGQEYEDYKIVWASPILLYRDGGKNSSSSNNAWDGQDSTIKDLDVYSKSLIVGYNRVGGFTGVTIGEFVDSIGDYTERHTGLYGFNKGASVFGLRDNGSAFFGRDGNGRILIDGEKSYLSSQEYLKSNGNDGLMIDFDDGFIELVNSQKGFIILDSEATGNGSDYPFKIGDRFHVNWNGTLYSKRGTFDEADINVANVSDAYIETSYLGGDFDDKDYTWEINSTQIKTEDFKISGSSSGGSALSITGACFATTPPEGASSGAGVSGQSYLGVYAIDAWRGDLGGVAFSPSNKLATQSWVNGQLEDIENDIATLTTRVNGLTSSVQSALRRISALESASSDDEEE